VIDFDQLYTRTNILYIESGMHVLCRQDELTKSGLMLEDGHLMLGDIIKLDLPKAGFAFLSACQTMTGEETPLEEASHIAGGILLAGYRSVVVGM
jgi:CHAT domain-containing protein